MTASAIRAKPVLRFCNALRLKRAEYWLALGNAEEAICEVTAIPAYARNHPEVIRVKQMISAFPDEAVQVWLAVPKLRLTGKRV